MLVRIIFAISMCSRNGTSLSKSSSLSSSSLSSSLTLLSVELLSDGCSLLISVSLVFSLSLSGLSLLSFLSFYFYFSAFSAFSLFSNSVLSVCGSSGMFGGCFKGVIFDLGVVTFLVSFCVSVVMSSDFKDEFRVVSSFARMGAVLGFFVRPIFF